MSVKRNSMDARIDNDGYISVWDISNISAPTFIKRLRPGGREGLPADFQLAHTLYPTLDGRYVYVEDWNGGHVVKIDTSTDKVVNVASRSNQRWHMPHGAFIPGTIR
jgi:hypothetical protein